MRALAFWKTVTLDQSNLLDQLMALFSEHGTRFCVIGGQAVNAYAEPVVSLDLDTVVPSYGPNGGWPLLDCLLCLQNEWVCITCVSSRHDQCREKEV